MSKKKYFFISLRRLKIHEFDSTLRYVHKSGSWVDLFQKLSDLQKNAIASFLKLCSPLILAYLALFSLNSDGVVGVTIQGVTAAIPTAHFAITTSLIFLFATLSLAHLLVVFSLRARQSARILLPGFSTNVFGWLHGHDEIALSIPIISSDFLREIIPVSKLLTSFLSIAFLGLLIPFFAFGYYLASVQFDLLFLPEVSMHQKIAAVFGIGLVICSVLYFGLFHTPLPMAKDKYLIRWGFLCKISRHFPHPQAKKWLDEK